MSGKCFVQGHINMAESCNQENIPRLKQLKPLPHFAESSHIMNWKKLSLLPVWPHFNEWMMMLAFDLALTELSDHYCPSLHLTEVLLKTWPCYNPCSCCPPTDNCSSFYFPLLSTTCYSCYLFNHKEPNSDHQITLMIASDWAWFSDDILVICIS